MLPYHGPAWYNCATVAFLLVAGVAKWSDDKSTFDAATHRPAKFLSELPRVLEQLWLGICETFPGVTFLEARR